MLQIKIMRVGFETMLIWSLSLDKFSANAFCYPFIILTL